MNPKLISHQDMRDDAVFGAAAVTCAAVQALTAALENHHPRLRSDPLSFVCGDLVRRQAQTIAALSTALQSAVADYLGSLTETLARKRDDDIPW
jgi:hypothetical protein